MCILCNNINKYFGFYQFAVLKVNDEQFQQKLKYIWQKTYLVLLTLLLIRKINQGAVQTYGKFLSKVKQLERGKNSDYLPRFFILKKDTLNNDRSCSGFHLQAFLMRLWCCLQWIRSCLRRTCSLLFPSRSLSRGFSAGSFSFLRRSVCFVSIVV